LANKVFDDVSNSEAINGHTDYRCLYFHNAGTDSVEYVALYIHQDLPESDSIEIGLAPEDIGNGSTTGVAEDIGTETTAPDSVTFSSPTEDSPLIQDAGTIVTGNSFGIWIKRTVPSGVAYSNTADAFVIGVRAFAVLP